MASNVFFKLWLSRVVVFVLAFGSANAQGLKVGFYKKTCPRAEYIVGQEMQRVIKVAPSLAGPLLRMHFHDCFVRGCDGSVLLNSTPNNKAEKEAIPNQSLRGFSVIDNIKRKLEKACPGVVSCADIVALVARDAVFLTRGPRWEVETGRRDGRISISSEALNELPSPFSNISTLKTSFAGKGLDVNDLVVLSGGHTLGTSHCPSFAGRLYNFNGTGAADPSLDTRYVPKLKAKCSPTDVTTLVEMDPGSFRTFDTSYFTVVSKRRGLFVSDDALLRDPQTKAYVARQANSLFPFEFFKDFSNAMIKMGRIQPLTGTQGEIRKQCAFVN